MKKEETTTTTTTAGTTATTARMVQPVIVVDDDENHHRHQQQQQHQQSSSELLDHEEEQHEEEEVPMVLLGGGGVAPSATLIHPSQHQHQHQHQPQQQQQQQQQYPLPPIPPTTSSTLSSPSSASSTTYITARCDTFTSNTTTTTGGGAGGGATTTTTTVGLLPSTSSSSSSTSFNGGGANNDHQEEDFHVFSKVTKSYSYDSTSAAVAVAVAAAATTTTTTSASSVAETGGIMGVVGGGGGGKSTAQVVVAAVVAGGGGEEKTSAAGGVVGYKKKKKTMTNEEEDEKRNNNNNGGGGGRNNINGGGNNSSSMEAAYDDAAVLSNADTADHEEEQGGGGVDIGWRRKNEEEEVGEEVDLALFALSQSSSAGEGGGDGEEDDDDDDAAAVVQPSKEEEAGKNAFVSPSGKGGRGGGGVVMEEEEAVEVEVAAAVVAEHTPRVSNRTEQQQEVVNGNGGRTATTGNIHEEERQRRRRRRDVDVVDDDDDDERHQSLSVSSYQPSSGSEGDGYAPVTPTRNTTITTTNHNHNNHDNHSFASSTAEEDQEDQDDRSSTASDIALEVGLEEEEDGNTKGTACTAESPLSSKFSLSPDRYNHHNNNGGGGRTSSVENNNTGTHHGGGGARGGGGGGSKILVVRIDDDDHDDDDGFIATASTPRVANNTTTMQEEDDDETTKRRSTTHRVTEALLVVFPKVAPVPWSTFIILSILIAIPSAVYILLFTKMGYGFDTMVYLTSNFSQYTSSIFGLLLLLFLSLYLLDAETWSSSYGKVSRLLALIIFVGGIYALVLFLAGSYPYGPICLFAVTTPLYMIMMKYIFYRKVAPRTYISWLSGPLLVVSVLVGIIWMVWTFLRDENEWNQTERLRDVESLGCLPDFSDYPECRISSSSSSSSSSATIGEGDEGGQVCFEIDEPFPEGCQEYCIQVYSHCINTFILWVGPLLVTISLFFLSFFCTFLRAESHEQELINFGKLWVFLLFAMWVAASLAGAGNGIMFALTAFTLAAFVGSGILLSMTYSSLSESERGLRFLKRMQDKYGGHLDVARGLIVVTCLPVFVGYLGLSFVNQCIRRLRICPCSAKPTTTTGTNADISDSAAVGRENSNGRRRDHGSGRNEEDDDPQPNQQEYHHEHEHEHKWLTEKASGQVSEVQKWDRAKIYTYAIYWGLAFMTMAVIVSEFTVLFMSWLIEETKSMSLLVVTFILVGVGLVMFLLPPVPGVPIYLTLGILCVATGMETLGIIGSMAYCAGVSLVLKLLACTLQQKCIGESLSKFVGIRQAVSINSTMIRSMRLILSQPGLGVAKVAILIGGPDWPTSVLCGIMRLNLFQILLGTLPIIFLILPTMLTGSFTYLASITEGGVPQYPWAGTVATICAALTAVVQFGSMLVAAYYLEQVASSDSSALEQLPYDVEVQRADEKALVRKKAYTKVTQWSIVPLWAKFILGTAVVAMVTCCYMVQLFSSYCFAEYELTYTIEEHLDGNVLNLVLPLGWASLCLFAFSFFLLEVFKTWASSKAKELIKEKKSLSLVEDSSPSTEEAQRQQRHRRQYEQRQQEPGLVIPPPGINNNGSVAMDPRNSRNPDGAIPTTTTTTTMEDIHNIAPSPIAANV